MPVPASYNDITEDKKLRDHVGLVWYDRTFFVPNSWQTQRVWLRFSAISYAAQVWVNGQVAMKHEIGHLPFQAEISHLLNFGSENRVTVACDNTLLPDTVPQGNVAEAETDYGKKLVQTYTFDFFNYAGIHRPVTLYTTPLNYIDDISIATDIDGTSGLISYNISYVSTENITLKATLYDMDDNAVAEETTYDYEEELGRNGLLHVPNVKLWWPYLMHDEPAYLYSLEIRLLSATSPEETLDIYRLPVGIRTITWTNTSVLMNNKPIYMHGFGRHEDADIRGKGLDLPTVVKDYSLIKWVGGNSYRTSHYPYAEEIMDMADKEGIMIIDECPSVDTELFTNPLLEKHKTSLKELIQRDKNRPSVIAWSIANEARTQTQAAGDYFGHIVDFVKSLDSRRPLTSALSRGVYEDKVGKHLDFISFNRYNAWYSNAGQLDMIVNRVVDEAQAWHNKYNKSVVMSEYGADTLAGLHLYPEYIWSEEFQVELMSRHFEAFDKLRERGWFIGEFVWNFADFQTAQTFTRAGGNKKGMFTRNRQPKAAAHHLRRRYLSLAHQLYNATLPGDLSSYVTAADEAVKMAVAAEGHQAAVGGQCIRNTLDNNTEL